MLFQYTLKRHFCFVRSARRRGGTEKQYVFKHSVYAVCYVKTKKSPLYADSALNLHQTLL